MRIAVSSRRTTTSSPRTMTRRTTARQVSHPTNDAVVALGGTSGVTVEPAHELLVHQGAYVVTHRAAGKARDDGLRLGGVLVGVVPEVDATGSWRYSRRSTSATSNGSVTAPP